MATPEARTPLGAVAGKRVEVPIKKATGPGDDKVHTWPFLVRSEFLCAIVITLLLLVWALLVDAPLEEPANPTRTPNPSKAPWYFLGLQEMLVFFDPWHAGVVLPTFIIIGLMVIPYIDINPKGNGYYCWKDRKWEILTFILGMNAYATPVLLGGPKFKMMGPLVYGQFQLNNWPFGASVAFVLMAATLGLTATANILIQRRFGR